MQNNLESPIVTCSLLSCQGPDCFDTLPYDWESVGLEHEIDYDQDRKNPALELTGGCKQLMSSAQAAEVKVADTQVESQPASPATIHYEPTEPDESEKVGES